MKKIITIVSMLLVALLAIGLTACGGGSATSYSVKFYDENGTTQIGVTQTVDKDGELTVPADPVKAGYEFDGWLLNGEVYNFTVPGAKKVTKDMTFKASYSAAKLTVLFYDADGITILDEQKVPSGGRFTVPQKPSKTGYVFNGWIKDGESALHNMNATLVENNLKFVANYTANSYTVKFMDGETLVCEDQTLDYDTEFTVPDATKTGYTFKGWTVSGTTDIVDFTADGSKIVRGDVTYVAKYEINVFAVKFYGEDGTTLLETKNIDYNAALTFPTDDPIKDNYFFKGWLKKTDNTWETSVFDNTGKVVTSDMEFKAAFGEKITLTYKFATGDEVEVVVAKGGLYKQPERTPDAAEWTKFAGWAIEGEGGVFDTTDKTVEEAKIFVPVFEATAYKITYNKPDGTEIKNEMVSIDASISFPTAYEGLTAEYHISGWKLNGAGDPVTSATCGNENASYTAVVTDNVDLIPGYSGQPSGAVITLNKDNAQHVAEINLVPGDFTVILDNTNPIMNGNKWFVFDLYMPDVNLWLDYGNYCTNVSHSFGQSHSCPGADKWHNGNRSGKKAGEGLDHYGTVPWYVAAADGTYVVNSSVNKMHVGWNRILVNMEGLSRFGLRLGEENTSTAAVKIANIVCATDDNLVAIVQGTPFFCEIYGHDYVLQTEGTTAPSCVNAGNNHYICSHCEGTKDVTVPATGIHIDEDHNSECDVCGQSTIAITLKKPDGTEISKLYYKTDDSIVFPKTYAGLASDQYIFGWKLSGEGEVLTEATCSGEASYTAVTKAMTYLIKNGAGNSLDSVAFETVDETAVAKLTLVKNSEFTSNPAIEAYYVVIFDKANVTIGDNKWVVFDLYIPNTALSVGIGNLCTGSTANHAHGAKWHDAKDGGWFAGNNYSAYGTVPWNIANSDGTYGNINQKQLSVGWNRIAVDISQLEKLGLRMGKDSSSTEAVKVANVTLATDANLADTITDTSFACEMSWHVWDEGVVTKEATTTETGIMTYTCTKCGETKTEEIAKKND